MTSVFPRQPAQSGARLGLCQKIWCQARSVLDILGYAGTIYTCTHLVYQKATYSVSSFPPPSDIRLDSSASAGSVARLDLVASLQMLGQILVARRKTYQGLDVTGLGWWLEGLEREGQPWQSCFTPIPFISFPCQDYFGISWSIPHDPSKKSQKNAWTPILDFRYTPPECAII